VDVKMVREWQVKQVAQVIIMTICVHSNHTRTH